jgi:hypothetical protein
MRILPLPLAWVRVLPAALGLLVLALVPAAWAAESLVLTCDSCTHVDAYGKGLPTNTTVRITLTDVRTGQQLVAPLAVQTDAQGSFHQRIMVDLFKHPSVESSVWTDNGSVLVVAAHNRFDAPCKDGKMLPIGHDMGMGGMEGHLAFTGTHAPQLVSLGFGLLAAGVALLVAVRRQSSRA